MEKAEALLAKRLPCLGCHTIDGTGGRIGPDLSDIGARRRPAYIEAMIRDPRGSRPGTLMPGTAMPESWRDLMTRYLIGRGGPVDEAPPAAASTAGIATDTAGVALYARHCATCHGAEGGGDGPNAPYLADPPTVHADSAYMSTRPDDTIYDGIAAGAYVLGKSNLMPAFGDTFTRSEIRSLVRHIRRLCRCEGPAWSRDGR
jgi:mono/diheme cytochrome c family protein